MGSEMSHPPSERTTNERKGSIASSAKSLSTKSISSDTSNGQGYEDAIVERGKANSIIAFTSFQHGSAKSISLKGSPELDRKSTCSPHSPEAAGCSLSTCAETACPPTPESAWPPSVSPTESGRTTAETSVAASGAAAAAEATPPPAAAPPEPALHDATPPASETELVEETAGSQPRPATIRHAVDRKTSLSSAGGCRRPELDERKTSLSSCDGAAGCHRGDRNTSLSRCEAASWRQGNGYGDDEGTSSRPRGSSIWAAVEHVRSESVTGFNEAIHKEGWLLKEPGTRAGFALTLRKYLKAALPLRRYITLFPSRIDYFAELQVTVKVSAQERKKREKLLLSPQGDGHVPGLGFYVDDFNKVTGFDAGAASAQALEVGDVITSVDGVACYVPDVVDGRSQSKYSFSLVRRKGCIPLSEGVVVKPCRSVLNRIKKEVSAFEINLEKAQVAGHKDRYIFICATEEEALRWRAAIKERCKQLSAAMAQATKEEVIQASSRSSSAMHGRFTSQSSRHALSNITTSLRRGEHSWRVCDSNRSSAAHGLGMTVSRIKSSPTPQLQRARSSATDGGLSGWAGEQQGGKAHTPRPPPPQRGASAPAPEALRPAAGGEEAGEWGRGDAAAGESGGIPDPAFAPLLRSARTSTRDLLRPVDLLAKGVEDVPSTQ